MRRVSLLCLAMVVLVPVVTLSEEAASPAVEPQKESVDEQPKPDEKAQVVLIIGDRKPITLAVGDWQSVQFIVSQVTIALDAMQWRELRNRMNPQPTKEMR